MDDAISQLMLRMQLQQLMANAGGATPGQGGYDPFKSDLPQAVRNSIDLQPSYAEGSVPNTPNPLLQNVLFGGEKGARNAPAGAGPGLPLEAAKELEKSGAKAPEIFNQTGWYRAPDGQWKWTLSDKGADLNKDVFQTYSTGGGTEEVALKLKGSETRKLHEVLSHPSLYETYPNLKNATVTRLPPEIAHGGAMADYDPRTNTVRVADHRPKNEVLSAILHELQHGIQSLEGFSIGGAPTEFYSPSDIQSASPEVAAVIRAKAQQDYSRLAGETEARQVQKQFETQNWSQLPTRMEGFPAPDQQLLRQPSDTVLAPGKSYQFTPSASADPITQLMLQMQLRSLEGDRAAFTQRPPVAFGVESARPPQAWFENPSWLQGYPAPPPEAAGMMQGPMPRPPGLSGGISGHGKLRDYFGPYSPLGTTYRHSWQF